MLPLNQHEISFSACASYPMLAVLRTRPTARIDPCYGGGVLDPQALQLPEENEFLGKRFGLRKRIVAQQPDNPIIAPHWGTRGEFRWFSQLLIVSFVTPGISATCDCSRPRRSLTVRMWSPTDSSFRGIAFERGISAFKPPCSLRPLRVLVGIMEMLKGNAFARHGS